VRRRARSSSLFDKPGASAEKLAFARWMRASPTPAEAQLWSALRGRRVGGLKFRRQHVIAGYIVDFYCPELRLAVEVDGDVHQARVAEDRQRDQDLALLGVCVLRLSNADVLDRHDDIIERIVRFCETLRR
jgi:very-short-patch-repair endonuclease